MVFIDRWSFIQVVFIGRWSFIQVVFIDRWSFIQVVFIDRWFFIQVVFRTGFTVCKLSPLTKFPLILFHMKSLSACDHLLGIVSIN